MNEEYLPIRLSHLISYYSVGSIIRGPEYLLSVKDIREWTDSSGSPGGRIINYVDRVRSALGIEQKLREPPLAQELDNGLIDGVCVPAVRFPRWMRCPKCGLLHYTPWRDLAADEKPHCSETNTDICRDSPELEQVPWVMVHPDGHLADVPWHRLAHYAPNNEQQQCRADRQKAYLRIREVGTDLELFCGRADCRARYRFQKGFKIPFGSQTWRQPWIFAPPDKDGNGIAEIMEINDARVYSPQTCSALVIPPESRIRQGAVVGRLYCSRYYKQIKKARTPLARKGLINTVAMEFRCTSAQIGEALQEIKKGYPNYGKNVTQGILLEDEYLALMREILDLRDDEDFVTRHHIAAWRSLAQKFPEGTKLHKIAGSIETITAVNRLKEIMVFVGFQRKAGTEEEAVLVPPDIIGESDWLPAIKLYGEGIFFNFQEDIMSRWEKQPAIKELAEKFRQRYVTTGLKFEPDITPSARFLFLHTMAHLLIRQLETKSGYPAASLKERIYCSAGKKAMSGILIYIAVPDIAGSLGGLAELAEPRRFLQLLSSVFDHAEWCSLDPVCSEHEGQGPHLLNRAACHACALIPEPSCACGNILLDRTFIHGDELSGIPPFLDAV
ncbi:hypothetical protein MNBD_DELTA03-828 [hydrothermal vent metagenome]|uniref:MrfA-like Zn-binding domain-containing protein n=1 Tax=hydrothermal vent metagenome TaxID=652676 RepID=A0A3B0VV75_9ZZZZ